MNYPFWEVSTLGGGLLIAIVAIFHTYVAQFAVGGGFFLVLAERKARRENDPVLLDYVRRHTRFFVLVTLVLGAVTGVGIWFTIALVNPQATSILIRSFVWGWAIEWVFFILEITAALTYAATWDRVKPETHQLVGWLYGAGAWLSLAVITGITSFMLTTGRWVETQNFWHGVLNPSYLPSVLMRTGVSFALAGLYGLITAYTVQPRESRDRLVRYCAAWLFPAAGLLVVGGAWYLTTIPEASRAMLTGGAIAMTLAFAASLIASVVLFGVGYFGLYRSPRSYSVTLAALLLIVGLTATGASEFAREGARKPYVLYGYLYSNNVYAGQEEAIRQDGFLTTARWARLSTEDVTPGNLLEAGHEVYRFQCASCHTLGGYNDVTPLVKGWTASFADFQLQHLDTLKGFMPPFVGTPLERRALAEYLASLNPWPSRGTIESPVPVAQAPQASR
ncbi:cytochrome ubiquinol oxidase subunit I [Limnochorda pilosa]|uniref:Cytochrome C n=1 Tax=Limnochorda pilosa TaxID=1555112 RepID=A0A0K2SNF4_LIMPI|nr:cytochrome ubiquinol oxidase subunit I [Limnochorda pilosa]BAS28359.1 cytochrome C [Limnochorda pilosa]